MFDLLQGSIVVFGAYSDWTTDAVDTKNQNYCAKPAFECAFVLLLLQWVKKSNCILVNPLNLECPDLICHHGLHWLLRWGLPWKEAI